MRVDALYEPIQLKKVGGACNIRYSLVSRKGDYFGGLEPYDGKLSRTVLRGERGRKAPDLPGNKT